jgi:hypothetical protein
VATGEKQPRGITSSPAARSGRHRVPGRRLRRDRQLDCMEPGRSWGLARGHAARLATRDSHRPVNRGTKLGQSMVRLDQYERRCRPLRWPGCSSGSDRCHPHRRAAGTVISLGVFERTRAEIAGLARMPLPGDRGRSFSFADVPGSTSIVARWDSGVQPLRAAQAQRDSFACPEQAVLAAGASNTADIDPRPSDVAGAHRARIVARRRGPSAAQLAGSGFVTMGQRFGSLSQHHHVGSAHGRLVPRMLVTIADKTEGRPALRVGGTLVSARSRAGRPPKGIASLPFRKGNRG